MREEAAQSFRAAVRVEPGIIEARFVLARLALQDGDGFSVRGITFMFYKQSDDQH